MKWEFNLEVPSAILYSKTYGIDLIFHDEEAESDLWETWQSLTHAVL